MGRPYSACHRWIVRQLRPKYWAMDFQLSSLCSGDGISVNLVLTLFTLWVNKYGARTTCHQKAWKKPNIPKQNKNESLATPRCVQGIRQTFIACRSRVHRNSDNFSTRSWQRSYHERHFAKSKSNKLILRFHEISLCVPVNTLVM